MFDWFREIGEELGGIDSIAAKKERMEKRERDKSECFIFTMKGKILIIVMGIIYLLMSGSTIMVLKDAAGAGKSVLHLVKYMIMDLIDIVVIIALIFGKRKGEIVALGGSFIFVVGLFFSVLFL